MSNKKQSSDLPYNWAWAALGDLTEPSNQKVDPLKSQKVPYVGLEHIEKDTGSILGYGNSADVRSTKTVFNKGDVLYGKLRPYLNKACIASFDGVCSTDILVFPKSSFICNKYLAFRFLRGDFVRFANQNVSGVQHPRVPFKILSQFSVPLPPLNEQKRIVEKIEALFARLDAGVEALKKTKAQLKRYRQAVLKFAMEGKLTEKWRKKNKITEKWEWTKLSTCSELITKGESPKWQGFNYVEKGVLFIRSENVLWGRLDTSESAKIPEEFHKKLKRSQIKAGDVLINLVGASIGRCAMVFPNVTDANINQAVALIRLNHSLNPQYLMHLLLSPQWQKNIHGSKVETARPNISLNDLREFVIPLPPLPEQRKIVSEIERRFSAAEEAEKAVEQSLTQAARLRQSILKRAFEGKLVPQNPHDEPAEKLLERIKAEKERMLAGKNKHSQKKSKP